MDFSARLSGLIILARFENTGLGYLTRAELRPALNPSPCNLQFDFKRICFRSRADISARLAWLKFQPRMKMSLVVHQLVFSSNNQLNVKGFNQ